MGLILLQEVQVHTPQTRTDVARGRAEYNEPYELSVQITPLTMGNAYSMFHATEVTSPHLMIYSIHDAEVPVGSKIVWNERVFFVRTLNAAYQLGLAADHRSLLLTEGTHGQLP